LVDVVTQTLFWQVCPLAQLLQLSALPQLSVMLPQWPAHVTVGVQPELHEPFVQLCPAAHDPQLPPQPSLPQLFPEQLGTQVPPPVTVTTTGIVNGEFFSVAPVTTRWPVNAPDAVNELVFTDTVSVSPGKVPVEAAVPLLGTTINHDWSVLMVTVSTLGELSPRPTLCAKGAADPMVHENASELGFAPSV
jgi:hypothetical protein